MESLLEEAAAYETPQCHSVDDIRERISQLLVGKISSTRVNHVSATFDLPSTVVLDFRSALAEGSVNIEDDGDGAGQATALHSYVAEHSVVSARDVIMDQPNDNPIVQRAVARLIASNVHHADGSTWVARPATRSGQGWTIMYACSGSMDLWKRAHPRRKTVGQSSFEDIRDAVLLSSPTFDCRGSITIAFSRFSRSIVVKYEHTNCHMTIADMANFFPPPRPPEPLVHSNTTGGVSNKRQKTAGEHGASVTPRAKRPRKPAATAATAATAVEVGETEGEERAERAEVTEGADTVEVTAVAPAGETTGPVTLTWVAEAGRSGTTPKPKRPRKPRKSKNAAAAQNATADASSIASAAIVASAAMAEGGAGAGQSTVTDLHDNKVANVLLNYLNEPPVEGLVPVAEQHTSGDTASEQQPTQAPEIGWSASQQVSADASHAASPTANQQPVAPAETSEPTATTASAPSNATATSQATVGAKVPPCMAVTEAHVSSQRKQTAVKLLVDRGVDPATLNHEQFCTFANQAPTLQKESLEMLALYGAERLAVVPPRKAVEASQSPTPSTGQSPTPPQTQTPPQSQPQSQDAPSMPASSSPVGNVQAQANSARKLSYNRQNEGVRAYHSSAIVPATTYATQASTQPTQYSMSQQQVAVSNAAPPEEASTTAVVQADEGQSASGRKPARRGRKSLGTEQPAGTAPVNSTPVNPPRKPRTRKSAAAATNAAASIPAEPNTQETVDTQSNAATERPNSFCTSTVTATGTATSVHVRPDIFGNGLLGVQSGL